MYPIGLSSCGKTLDEQLFADYARAGISAMEISLRWDGYKFIDYRKLEAYAKQYKIALWSYHLPFEITDLSTPERGWRGCETEYLAALIKQGSDIGIQKFVVHPSIELPIDVPNRQQRIELAKEMLNYLAEIATMCGSEICVENLPRGCLGNCSDEILDLISVNDKLRICFDTNHLLKEDLIHFIRCVGNKITTLHVSDYDFVDERHWLPGEGKIQWPAVLIALQECGYHGPWMYEIPFDSNETIRGRKLTCGDFVDNAHKLFRGEGL